MPFPVIDPEIVGKGVTVKTIISTRRQTFTSGAHTIAAASVPERMNDQVESNASRMIPVHRHSDITIEVLTLDYGITDDPADELILFMLTMHPDTLVLTGDDLQNFIDQSFWMSAQNWRLLTAVGVIQTLSREQAVILQEAIFTDGLLKQDSYHIGLIVASDTTSAVRADGNVTWTEILYQRRWPNRNSSEWAGWGYKEDEENYGQFGS